MTKTAISPRAGRDAFTLIELLIVIIILAILSTIFVPVINKAIQAADNARSRAFVQRVALACGKFKDDNSGKYPGQDDLGILKGSPGGLYTGSQMLASRLFGYPESEITNLKPQASSKYLDYKLSRLISKSSKGLDVAPNSMGDESSTTNVLLYFPSRFNETTPTGCYNWLDNSEDAKPIGVGGGKSVFDSSCATDARLSSGNNARNAGGMLIIGTGGNDMYLESGDDNDDIRSWEKN